MRLPYPTDKGRGERVYLEDVVVVVCRGRIREWIVALLTR